MIPQDVMALISNRLEKIELSYSLQDYLEVLQKGSLFSSDKPLYTSREKSEVRNETDADIVDMEAFWIAEFCNQHEIPFISLKVVSDDLQDFSLADFKHELRQNAELLVKPVDKIVRTLTI